jgi:hypothetical protein
VHSMCVDAAQPLGRFMAVSAVNALAVDFGIQAIAGVFPYWDMLYRNYHGLGFRPLETMVWADEWKADKAAPELHWRLATVPVCAFLPTPLATFWLSSAQGGYCVNGMGEDQSDQWLVVTYMWCV